VPRQESDPAQASGAGMMRVFAYLRFCQNEFEFHE